MGKLFLKQLTGFEHRGNNEDGRVADLERVPIHLYNMCHMVLVNYILQAYCLGYAGFYCDEVEF